MKAKRGRGPRRGHGGSGADLQKDLQLIQSDPRFAHVASDPKYRHIPKKERKVKLDSRFHSILTDEKFYEKSTMDPRGRKGNYSTKEDLLRFYHMSSDEDSEEEEDGDDEEEEEEDGGDDEEEEEDDDEDNEDKKEEKTGGSREEGNENLYISTDRKGKRDKGLKKGRKPEEESGKGKKEVKEKTKQEKGKKSITEQETTEREEDDGDEVNKEQEEDTSKRDEEERSQVTPEVRSRLKDLTRDYARGGGDLFSSDSSDDDSTTTDEEEEEAEEFEWAELDQDAVWDNEAEVEETSRIAICNLDWDRIKAADLMVLFSSFCPRGSSVRSVAIYPSEYGKQRMAEEDRSGPQELTGRGKKWKGKEEEEDEDEEEEEEENKRTVDLVDLDKLEKGKLDESVGATKRDFEALRRYQRNRLRYYYAVMECDTVDTARALYKECDRQPFEGAGILLDMRYIPSDMVFDETPHDLCRTVPQTYRAKSFVTTALQSTRPALTWDETDPDRAKTLGTAMAQALKGGSLDDDQLRDFIATSSEEEDEDEGRAEEEEDDNSSDEDGNEDVKAARIAKFRALIQEIDEKERRRKEREIDMEDTLEEKEVEEEEEEGEQEEEEEKKSTKDAQLNPFEKYLEKRRAKKKERRQKQKGKKMKGGTEENSDTDDDAISDDDLPEGMDDLYSDPFFAEELENRKKEKKRIKKKKDEDGEKEEDDSTDKGNLELLLMDEEEEDKRHFNMREIIKSSEQDTRKKKRKKNLKKKMKEKQEEQKKKVDDFKVNISDPRFSELMMSGEYNIDPSHPQFKRTKAMDGLIGEIQRKRRVESGEELPGVKRPHLEEETKRNLELTSLVQRVKRKTGKGKKPAKRNDHDTT